MTLGLGIGIYIRIGDFILGLKIRIGVFWLGIEMCIWKGTEQLDIGLESDTRIGARGFRFGIGDLRFGLGLGIGD